MVAAPSASAVDGRSDLVTVAIVGFSDVGTHF